MRRSCLLLSVVVAACGGDDGAGPGAATSGETSGTTAPGSGTGPATTGPGSTGSGSGTSGPATDSGASTSGGSGTTSGSGTGSGSTGGSGAAFECPAGSEGLVPDLDGKSAQSVGMPPAFENWQSFLEGAVWAEDAVFVSQIRNYAEPGAHSPSRILKYVPGGGFEVFLPDGGTNGLALRASGLLLGASQKEHGLVEIDPTNPAAVIVPVVTAYMGAPFNSPNDVAIRSDGNLYFTDPKWQCDGAGCGQGGVERAYRVDPMGNVTEIVGAPNVPNGSSLAPDENTLYLGGAGQLTAFPVDGDGSLGAGAAFGDLSGVDGMAIDCAGHIYATVGGNVTVLTPAGDSLGTINVNGTATNAAFGGTDRQTLYITTMNPGGLHAVDLNVPGFPY